MIAILVCSCEDNEMTNQPQSVKVTGEILSSRTAYSSENGITNVSWVEGDEIGLFSTSQRNVRYVAENSGANASFKELYGSVLVANEGDTILAYYPYSRFSDDNAIEFPWIHQQECDLANLNGSEKTLPEIDFMIAKGKVEKGKVNLHFEHFLSFIKITLPLNVLTLDAEKLGVRIESTENISTGYAPFDVESETLTEDYKCNCINFIINGIDETKDEVSFTVAVLPQTENAQFTFKKLHFEDDIERIGDLIMRKKAPKGGFKAGKVYKINFDDYSHDTDSNIDNMPEYEL